LRKVRFEAAQSSGPVAILAQEWVLVAAQYE